MTAKTKCNSRKSLVNQGTAIHRGYLNRLFAIIMCLSLVFGLLAYLPTTASYADVIDQSEVVAQGYCGDPEVNDGENLTWVLDNTGKITISGTGAMANYNYVLKPGWVDYIDSIDQVVIEQGVTSIGDKAFGISQSLKVVYIPESVTSIGSYAFYASSQTYFFIEGETPPAGYKLDTSITDSTKCPPGISVKSKCTYHYYNDSVKCYYYTKASRTLVTCASKQYSGNYKCNSDETRGTQTCNDASTETVTCVKNKATVYTTTKAYEVSQDGAYGKSASEAVEECKKAANKYCTDKGYSGADAQNCKAVQDWTASGYDGQGNPKTQTLKHQSSQPNCNAFNQVAYCLSIECNG